MLFLLALCTRAFANGHITNHDVASRVAYMEYGDPSTPPAVPSFINESISIVLTMNVRGILQGAAQDGSVNFGLWHVAAFPKLATIAFLTGKVLPPPTKTTNVDVKYSLWLTDECMDPFNISVCNAPYAMSKFNDMLWGDLRGGKYPPTKATLSAGQYHTDAARLASIMQVPQIGWETDFSLLSNKVDFPGFMRTLPSVKDKARAMAIYLRKLNAYTRIDMLTCDVASEKSQIDEITSTFRDNGISSIYVMYWPQMQHSALPPSMMADISLPSMWNQAEAGPIATRWSSEIAGMKANNAHVHIMQMHHNCPYYDVLAYCAMNDLVAPGHLWLGQDLALTTYEGLYLNGLRYWMPTLIGFQSPYAFLLPLEGYIQILASQSDKVSTFWQWLQTLESSRADLFEPWLDKHFPVGMFANATTTFKSNWGPESIIGRGFDAVWTYLLAINSLVNETGSTDFSPQDLFKESLKQRFEGLSGFVRFNETTGDRIIDYDFMQYRYQSIKMPSPKCADNATTKQFQNDLIALHCNFPTEGSSHLLAKFGGSLVIENAPVFYGGSTDLPPDLNILCPTGEMYNVVTGGCDKCPPGTHNDERGRASCDQCRPGFFADSFGMPYCKACAEGSITTQAGSTACLNCSAGTYANTVSLSVCFNCAAGLYSGVGYESCEACPMGSYQDTVGQGACKPCGDTYPGTTSGQASKSAQECFCLPGQYYRPGIGCTICVRGLDCPSGREVPRQIAGFYVETLEAHTRHYRVFQCTSEEWCPSGELATCTHPRNGRSCAVVVAEKCSPWIGLSLPIVLSFVIYLIYRFTANKQYRRVSSMMILVGNLGIALSCMQAVSVYVMFYEKVPDELGWLFRIAEVFMFKWQGIFPECNLGVSFAARLFLSVVPPLAIIGVAAFNFGVTNILGKIPHLKILSPMQYGATWNCAGTLIQIMYISQCKDAFSYFSSKENPSGEDTLREFSDVLLWSDEHVAVVPVLITIYLWFFYVIGTYSVFAYQVVVAKSKTDNDLFWQKWRFIFSRWRPEFICWGCIMLLRNLCIALIPIVVRTDQVYRAFAFNFILGGHALLEAYYRPWMAYVNNSFSIGLEAVLCGMAMIGLAINDSATKQQKTTASFVMLFLMCCIWFGLILSFCHALLWSRPTKVRLRQRDNQKAASGLLEKSSGILEAICDDDNLRRLWLQFAKSCSTHDKFVYDGALHLLNEFGRLDPLRRRMQSSRSSFCLADNDDHEPKEGLEKDDRVNV